MEPLELQKINQQKEIQNELVVSYMTLRNLIGVSGALLPIVLGFTTYVAPGGKSPQPSISDYYYTSNGDVLVVMLCVLSVFLLTYNGYNWKEKALSVLAAICGIGVAFSPTVAKFAEAPYCTHVLQHEVPKIFGFERHLIFAVTFFVSLSIISLRFFPKTKGKTDARKHRDSNGKLTRKGYRNIVYVICGYAMLTCVAILTVYFLYIPFKKAVGDFPIIFTLETVALEFFALSWLTKGESIFPDGQHYVVRGIKKAGQYLNKK